MIVAGASRHAKEILQILREQEGNQFVLFDDVSSEIEDYFDGTPIVRSLESMPNEVKKFVLALGGTNSRKYVFEKLTNIGLEPISVVASSAVVGIYRSHFGKGLNIMHHCFISDGVKIGQGCLINALVSIHHDVVLGDFVEVSPGASILGGCQIGALTSIGSGARILPNVHIGRNCKIGAGTIVTKDLPDNVVAVGVPARIVKVSE
jgi:sugar O-acyltransferase (sialic acid O-acetyltransferase NeuD family)